MPVRAWKARKRLQSVSGGQARRYPSQGLPSVLQRWGSGGSPDGFRLRSRRCRNRGGSVVLEIGEQKHARDFEAAKEQCRIDNPLEIACNVLWIVRLPLAL